MGISTLAIIGAIALSFAASPVAACDRGLGWATDNTFAPVIGSKPRITWYHHWQNGPVSTMPSKDEFVPMYWGTKYKSLWEDRVKEMNKKAPKHLMAFNEPDVKSQSNMDPTYAATLYMQQIYPWSKKGTKLGSPAVVWDLNWMETFLKAVKSKGGHVDFLCLHWYGSWKDLSSFKSFVGSAHSRFGLDIWIPEVGVTTASKGSSSQVKGFMMNALSWLDSQSYVQRVAWFGSFQSDKPPDDFATGKNALFTASSKGQLSDAGYWYAYSSKPDKRSLRSRHHLYARNATEEIENVEDAVHCDETCTLRNTQLAEYAATLTAPINIDE